MGAITVTPIAGALGAEIGGIDLSLPLQAEDISAMRAALLQHLVIFFRDQKLTSEQYMAFAKAFGEPVEYPLINGIDGFPFITEIVKREDDKANFGGIWHADTTYLECPPMGSILYLTEVPPDGGGDTLFANMYRAYETLSEPIKKMLTGLTALHDSSKAHYYRVKATDRDDIKFPNAEHPIVRTHPVTGKQGLYVNRGFTLRIPQLRRNESDALLEMLYRHIETPEFQCRFKWQPNSVAFWDNRCAQHHAMFDYYPHRRYGHRVTVCGDKPFHRA